MADNTDLHALAQRYARVKSKLAPNVTLVAVSKTRTVAEIQALYDLGHRDFGENYPQELRDKYPLLPGDIRWHFIGSLQRNKVKYVAPIVHLVHAVDRAALLDELEKHASSSGRMIDVLLQLHIAQEESKHGMSALEVREVLQAWQAGGWPHLRIRGLMGMASLTADRGQLAREFDQVATLHATILEEGLTSGQEFDQLSMGMSSDSDLAIASGSTIVRIGTDIFGERIAQATLH